MDKKKETVFLLILFMLSCRHVVAPPARSTDNFVSQCAFVEHPLATASSRQKASVAQLWSSPSTWPQGTVPGVGRHAGANVTIPCGKTVILDVPNLTLGLLRVRGLLRFLDDQNLPLIHVKANYVLVEGQLFIGTSTKQFSQKAIIELTPNTAGGRSPLQYTSSPPAEPAYPRNLGHKAFAIVGGQVKLHGLPGPPGMRVWVRLSRNANKGDTTIQVDGRVEGSWPAGGAIAITSSDYDRAQTETFQITRVVKSGGGGSLISLDRPLKYNHYGTVNGLSDGFGGFVDERSEVMLLSRNIVISGTEEPPPFNLEGGHLMVFMTKYPPQHIEGVEFLGMGQQGTLGRYPIHFHIMGAVPGTVCRKNSILQSKQRCIVIHASHELTIESNVAFNTTGHCFMMEEGGEQNNSFIGNIGVHTNAASVKISPIETDNRPATFWIPNPKNSFIGNVGAGSGESGFWFELKEGVRGNSLDIPELRGINPRQGTVTLFLNNVAHSNDGMGLRTYPHGMRPRLAWNRYGPSNVFDGVRIFKNKGTGLFAHNTDSLVITNSVFADNGRSVDLNKDARINVTNSRFVAFTDNLGNPSDCDQTSTRANCRPASPKLCEMPLKAGAPGRSTGRRNRFLPNFGVIIDDGTTSLVWPHTLKNLSFSNYDPTCAMNAAIVTNGGREFWNPALSVEALRFSSNTLPLYSPPTIAELPNLSSTNHGEQAQFHMFYDKDGSFNNRVPAMIITNATEVLPPGLASCTPKPAWNVFACTGVCYRALVVRYPEPGFSAKGSNVFNTRAGYSYLKVTRVSDGKQLVLDGNLRDTEPSGNNREYAMNLLAGQTYRMQIVPPPSKPFAPPNISVDLRDVGECSEGLTLQFRQDPNRRWRLMVSNKVFPGLCPGVQRFPEEKPTAQYRPVCLNNERWMEVSLSGGLRKIFESPSVSNYINFVTMQRVASNDNGLCSVSFSCSLLWSGTEWLYDDFGLERRPAFHSPILSQTANWRSGKAALGFATFSRGRQLETLISPPLPSKLVTYYFRKTFSLTHINCYSALTLDIIVNDGLVLYINNVEALRINLSPGYLDNKTNALAAKPWLTWESFVIPLTASAVSLVEGSNTVAVEVHVASGSKITAFDMRVTATRSNDSCRALQTPRSEVCDGLDNDLDGTVDLDASGKPLTKQCSTICGVGIMTCINGFFQQCSAVAPSAELCDGKDNNCDGLVDNGREQLNCSEGSVCYQGRCLPTYSATSVVRIWSRNASDWSYHDKGEDLDSTEPSWRTGTTAETWARGKAPLGFDLRSPLPSWQWFGTRIRPFVRSQNIFTAYFAKTFDLTPSDLTRTFSLDLSVRRVDGVLVYLNGFELWRDNMPAGRVSVSTVASGYVDSNMQGNYYSCTSCGRENRGFLKAGTNFVVAELHVNTSTRRTAAFDMDLYRNEIINCPSATPSCVRHIKQPIMNSGASWKYLDGSLSLPPSDLWMSFSYDDSSWPTGSSPLGYGVPKLKTPVNSGSNGNSEARRVLYLRKWVDLPEASCFTSILFNFIAKDGGVIFINGVEALRNNLRFGQLNSTVFATGSTSKWIPSPHFSGGWLKSGKNLFAVAVHRRQGSPSTVFDFDVVGVREGISCGVGSAM